MLEDEELFALIAEGNHEAFAEIYNRYWDRLLSIAVNRLGVESDAEECVQEVFLSVWNRRGKVQLNYKLSTYLAVAIKYQVINRLNKRFKLQKVLSIEELEDYENVQSSILGADSELLEKELLLTISKTVSKLPEKCQIVYKMSRNSGKTNKEIAEKLQISEKTVEGHITKALKEIRSNLSVVAPLFLVGIIL